MAKENCINHIKDTYMAILREDYYILCNKNHCSAMILNEFENWMNVKTTNKTQEDYETMTAEQGDVSPPSANGLWVWKSQEQLRDEMYGLFGIGVVRKSLNWLVNVGYLYRRRNPKYNWDKTYQYMLNVKQVQQELDRIAVKIKEGKDRQLEKTVENLDESAEKVNEIALFKNEPSKVQKRVIETSDLSNRNLENEQLNARKRGSNTIDNYIDNNNIDNDHRLGSAGFVFNSSFISSSSINNEKQDILTDEKNEYFPAAESNENEEIITINGKLVRVLSIPLETIVKERLEDEFKWYKVDILTDENIKGIVELIETYDSNTVYSSFQGVKDLIDSGDLRIDNKNFNFLKSLKRCIKKE